MNRIAVIIEDDPILATIFGKALQDIGYETEVINDGRLAEERLQEIVPIVIVLDLHLPKVSGEELLQQIKANGRLADTRIIIVSADATLVRQLRPQVDLALEKPVSFHQLRMMASKFAPLEE
jgi:two-component system cell cycle response regulator DivK